MTLTELKMETAHRSNVRERHPWIGAADVQMDLATACIKLREPKKTLIAKVTDATLIAGNRLLAQHCKANNTAVLRELSPSDARALAVADVLGAGLATDEWPLRLVATQTGAIDPSELYMSVEILHLLEAAGKLTKDERVTTVRSWVQQEDGLPRDWQTRYQTLFGEAPPDGQSDRSAKA